MPQKNTRQTIDAVYSAIYDAYMSETDVEMKAVYDNALTVIANIELLNPELA